MMAKAIEENEEADDGYTKETLIDNDNTLTNFMDIEFHTGGTPQ